VVESNRRDHGCRSPTTGIGRVRDGGVPNSLERHSLSLCATSTLAQFSDPLDHSLDLSRPLNDRRPALGM
jgi:hypothetical protein